MLKEKREGLGDQVERVIKKKLPKIADKYKECKGCKKRRIFLNNFNAVFK